MANNTVGAFAYFDQNGNLLEFISDPGLRQGNQNVSKIYIYNEPKDFNYNGKSLNCYYKNVTTGDTYSTQVVSVINSVVEKVMPTFKDYDCVHFVSGEVYPFIELEIPSDVLAHDGSISLSLAFVESGVERSFNSVINFYVDGSVLQYTETISHSDYDYLLEQIGKIADGQFTKDKVVFKVYSRVSIGDISQSQWQDGQTFLVMSDGSYSNHTTLLIKNGSSLDLIYDFNDYYTKYEVDQKVGNLQSQIYEKSSVSGTTDSQGKWNSLTIDGETHPLAAGGGTAYQTFTNPVLTNNLESDYFPDPTIWQGNDGFFYAAATTYGKHLFRSSDLVNWIDCGCEPISTNAKTTMKSWGFNKMWAPSVHKIGNKWLMYVSLVKDNAEPHESAICVLSSDVCYGFFDNPIIILKGNDVNHIDPFVYNTGSELWLIYGSRGGVYRIRLNDDGLSIHSSNSQPIHTAGLTTTDDQTRETVFEGPYLYRRGKYLYLFVSSGKSNSTNYKLKVGRADITVDTWDFKDKDGNSLINGQATTILSDSVRSPGHNGNIFVDGLGKTYMFYHARLKGVSSGWDRAMYLQELKWDNTDWCYFENGSIADTEIYPYNVTFQNNEIGFQEEKNVFDGIALEQHQSQLGYHLCGTHPRLLKYNKNKLYLFSDGYYLTTNDNGRRWTSHFFITPLSETTESGQTITKVCGIYPFLSPNNDGRIIVLYASMNPDTPYFSICAKVSDTLGENFGARQELFHSTSGYREPFYYKGWIYYSSEHEGSGSDKAQSIYRRTLNVDLNGVINAGSGTRFLDGRNKVDTDGNVNNKTRLDMISASPVLNGHIFVFESSVNINASTPRPMVVQYCYVEHPEDNPAHPTSVVSLFLGSSGKSCGAPFVTTLDDGRIVISFQTNENYTGYNRTDFRDSQFVAFVSKRKVAYNDNLTSDDFVKLTTYEYAENEYGILGSVANIDGVLHKTFTIGLNHSSADNTQNEETTIVQIDFQYDYSDKVANATNDNLVALDANGNLKDSGINKDRTLPPKPSQGGGDKVLAYDSANDEEKWQTLGSISVNVPASQSNTVVVQNALTNISGKSLTTFTATTSFPVSGYEGYQILKNGNVLTESEAAVYMEAQTGSSFVPKYNFDTPTYSYFIFADGTIYKPQWDSTNGLLLFKMNNILLNPMTTAGDIVVNGSNGPQRLGIGSNGQVLRVLSGEVKWSTIPSYVLCHHRLTLQYNDLDASESFGFFFDIYLQSSTPITTYDGLKSLLSLYGPQSVTGTYSDSSNTSHLVLFMTTQTAGHFTIAYWPGSASGLKLFTDAKMEEHANIYDNVVVVS